MAEASDQPADPGRSKTPRATSRRIENSTITISSTSTAAVAPSVESGPLARASAITATATVGDTPASTVAASDTAARRCRPARSGAIGSHGQNTNNAAASPIHDTTTVTADNVTILGNDGPVRRTGNCRPAMNAISAIASPLAARRSRAIVTVMMLATAGPQIRPNAR